MLSATLTFEESSPFPGGAGSTAPLVFQEKPGTQLFFFRKTSSSAQKFLKRSSLYFNKSQVCSFSSFEKHHHRPGRLSSRADYLSTKTRYTVFLLWKSSSTALCRATLPCDYREHPTKQRASIWVRFASLALLQRHGCSAFAGWLRPIPARGI